MANLVGNGHVGEEVREDGKEELDVVSDELGHSAVVESPENCICVTESRSSTPDRSCNTEAKGEIDRVWVPAPHKTTQALTDMTDVNKHTQSSAGWHVPHWALLVLDKTVQNRRIRCL